MKRVGFCWGVNISYFVNFCLFLCYVQEELKLLDEDGFSMESEKLNWVVLNFVWIIGRIARLRLMMGPPKSNKNLWYSSCLFFVFLNFNSVCFN